MKFKLKGGSHIQDDVTYNKGDTITTDIDLAAKFGKHRFERIGRMVDDNVKQPEIKSVRKGKGKKKKTSSKKTSSKPLPSTSSKTKKEVKKEKYGMDVTEDFPTAVEAGFTIFEEEHWFTIVDENDEVLNDKKMRKKDVPAFLENYLAEDGDETEEVEEEVEFNKGDRVIIEIDDVEYAGVITLIKGEKATIKFDDGDVDTYALDELVEENDED